ncbi:MAG: hypothetical protein NW206_11495 [Hyphomonadaceae bacterium]|nr:hypothetical protein [Hyphomonadaceae bacterium]
MRSKWIDNSDYIGPDRRRITERRLFKERRKFDETGEPPSLPSMIRRLRVQLLGLHTPHDKTHMMQLARAAILQAQTQRKIATADLIKEAASLVHSARHIDPALAQLVDAKLIDALDKAN